MLSVVALGIFMGKQVFRLMEVGSSPGDSKQEEVAKSDLTEGYTEASETDTTILTSHQEVPPIGLETDRTVTSNISTAPTQEFKTSERPKTQEVSTQISKIETRREEVRPMERVSAPSTIEPVERVRETVESSGSSVKTFAFANGSGINVRTGPSTREKMLFKIGNGTKGLVLEKRNGWTHILWDFNKEKGWVRDDLLTFSSSPIVSAAQSKTTADKSRSITPAKNPSAPENIVAVAMAKPADIAETTNSYKAGDKLPTEAVINAETFANIRSLPTTSSEKVGTLPKGMVVKVKNVKKEGRWQWFEIIYQAGRKTGWTREDNLMFQ